MNENNKRNMNQVQIKFLIERIQSETKAKIAALKKTL